MAFKKTDHTFEVEINGSRHVIYFYKKSGNHYLIVDGDQKEIFKPSSFIYLLFNDINDYNFSIDSTQLTIAVRYGKTRLAVNGKYTDNGAEFIAVRPLPVWAFGFIAAIIAPALYLKVQTMDVIVSLLFAYLCTHYIMKNPDIKATNALRALYCTGITAVSWLSLWFFNFM